ncbi:hypothetical protein SGQ83_22200 [Flavobacterium sp. Fl-318]|uniref:CHAT domain-containing protein n=1 Tax=Flavobacterium cupriresistens TaxID=2893885 RepID=A0ABU4RHM7_9FLAO|nr:MULTISPECIES: hypothetical protein [unclassified Flavobacterium]MDX6192068.1 hypothetical protein [Flavobacterium sp. Fl-318]UFH44676.1 hypothetical protein LNP23_10860 [Flavobacterium sp. F-323]
MKKFYFIQSLKTEDPNLGEQIYTHINQRSESAFFNVKSKDELFEKLNLILDELKSNNIIDGIIHFHTHGNEEGIGLFNDENKLEFAKWKDLRPVFRDIYTSTSKKPMISICACKGFNISKLVPHFEPCPYDYITGSFDPIGFNDSVNGYKLFYDGIIDVIDLTENIKRVNQNFPKMNFACFNSDQIFKIAEVAYRNSEMVSEKILIRRTEFERIIKNEFGFINMQQKLFLDFALSENGTDFYMEKFKESFYQ